MFSRRLYYAIKPALPWQLRMSMRRLLAKRILKAPGINWPIDESAARAPDNWTGWPEGRKFAFVITHDVEGPAGLAKVRRLAELEMELGFRSSFNLIPEGPYAIPTSLREWLVSNGFEVGVHDLRHDGRLFRSRASFRANAGRINGYLRNWGASGFRGGFMLRNLEWMHELDVGYDASTFDTDPFEPQPDGVGSIFPFWIPRPGSRSASSEGAATQTGYVELPYTLPQDSTLFLLLRKKTPEIWLRKLDWVASHGGMALVNVHPDYLRFPDEPSSDRTFDVAHYRALLRHILDHHAASAWRATPKEVAAHVRAQQPRPQLSRKLRVCMVTHSHYASDSRVLRYAEALAARGDHVDVLGLRSHESQPSDFELNGVRVHCVQNRFFKNQRRPLDFLFPLLTFFAKSAWWIARNPKRYDLFHIHNIPDFLVFVAFWPRRRGARVILDIHDLVPDFYASKFGLKESSSIIRILRWIERLSARHADHIIIANDLWLPRYQARTGSNGKCTVFINNVDDKLFYRRSRQRSDDRKIILFPGGLQPHQGLDIALRALPAIKAAVPRVEFHIYGDGSHKPELEALVDSLGLRDSVFFFAPQPAREIAGIMAEADLAVVPKRADSFGNEAYSTKIMEFMALGVPVVASDTKIERYYFNGTMLCFFRSGDDRDLAEKSVRVLTDSELRRQLVESGALYAAENCWGKRKNAYLALVDGLASRNPDRLREVEALVRVSAAQ